ncbi:hypothetical protein ACSGMG_001043 [Escherichia coli]|nr:hypothetical protein [Escherichia coli]EKY0700734.1 hypothetical protein [Escherichia coli]MCI4587047.1 hypothetical protein [Escherichia coli]
MIIKTLKMSVRKRN